MSCGSAPISAPAMDFLRVSLLCDLLEGKLRPFYAVNCSLTDVIVQGKTGLATVAR